MDYMPLMRSCLLLSLLATVLVGCSEETDARLSVAPRTYTAECTPVVEFCDATRADCQQQLFDATACVRRQDEDVLPPIRTIDTDVLRDEITAMVEEAGGMEASPWDVALQLMELIPAQQSAGEATVEDLVAGVAAFYSPTSRDVTIVEGSDGGDERIGSAILSHEFVHVLQDRGQGLMAVQEQWTRNTDTSVAVTHLVEGEAVVVSTIVTAHGDGLATGEVAWGEVFDEMLGDVLEVVEEAPSPFITALQTLPYPLGGRVLADVRDAGGQEALEAFYREGPGVTIDWLQLRRPRPGGDLALPDCFPQPPAEGRGVIGLDSFGPLGLVGLLVGQGLVGADALEIAAGLRADAIAVFVDAERQDAVAVEWRLEFESESLAAAAVSTLDDADFASELRGAVLRLWAAEPDAPLAAIAQRDGCGDLRALSDSLVTGRVPVAATALRPRIALDFARRVPSGD